MSLTYTVACICVLVWVGKTQGVPSPAPTSVPTSAPTAWPTYFPSTSCPTQHPTKSPSKSPAAGPPTPWTSAPPTIERPPPSQPRRRQWGGGDPHFITMDGLVHHFQGLCDYYYVKQVSSSPEPVPFDVIGSHSACGTLTCLQSIKFRLLRPPFFEVTLYPFGRYTILKTINKTNTTHNISGTIGADPVILPIEAHGHRGGGIIEISRFFTDIQLLYKSNRCDCNGRDLWIRFSLSGTRVTALVDPCYANQVGGLLGFFSGDRSDELQHANGFTPLIDLNTIENFWNPVSRDVVQQFGNTWLVDPRKAGACIQSPIPQTQCDLDNNYRLLIQQTCLDLVNEFERCVDSGLNGVLSRGLVVRFCIIDLCHCPSLDPTCANIPRQDLVESCNSVAPQLSGQAWGDPHYHTIDGLRYDFHGLCSYTLMTDIRTSDFEVIGTNTPCALKSCVDSLKVIFKVAFDSKIHYHDPIHSTKHILRYGILNDTQSNHNETEHDKIVIRMNLGPKIWLNDVLLSLKKNTTYDYDGFHLICEDDVDSGLMVTLITDIGLRVSWNGASYSTVSIHERYYNQIGGLLGTLSNNIYDDFRKRDGSNIILSNNDLNNNQIRVINDEKIHDFALSWSRPQSSDPSDCKTDLESDLEKRQCKNKETEYKYICKVHLRSLKSYRICIKNGMDKNEWIENCYHDLCSCLDNNFHFCIKFAGLNFIEACHQGGKDTRIKSTISGTHAFVHDK